MSDLWLLAGSRSVGLHSSALWLSHQGKASPLMLDWHSCPAPNVLGSPTAWLTCHLQRAAAEGRVRELEAERDAAAADASQWRHQHEQQQLLVQQLQQQQHSAVHSPAVNGLQELPPDVTTQLAALQQQLESLAADGQERARMSIAIRTIKVGAGAGAGAPQLAARIRLCGATPG